MAKGRRKGNGNNASSGRAGGKSSIYRCGCGAPVTKNQSKKGWCRSCR